MTRARRADLMLLIVTVCWGVSFPAIKAASPYISATLFVALRFWAATLLLIASWPWFLRTLPAERARRGWKLVVEPVALRYGLEVGVLAAIGYTTQTVGMHTTTANNSAFITALSVVLVPVFLFAVHRSRPRIGVLASVVLAVIGLMLLTRPDLGGLVTGDWWTLATAVSYAIYLIRLSTALTKVSYLPLLFWTMATCAVVNTALLGLDPPHVTWGSATIGGLIVTTLLSTMLALSLQNRFQAETTPTRAALIFSAEPVTAAMFSWLLLGETLGGRSLLGAGLILAAVVVTEATGAGDESGSDAPMPPPNGASLS